MKVSMVENVEVRFGRQSFVKKKFTCSMRIFKDQTPIDKVLTPL